MKIALLSLCLVSGAWGAEPRPRYTPYFPASHAFSCEIPTGWIPFEEQTPRANSVHILGPSEARGAFRAAFHVHYFEKGRAGFVPWQEALAKLRARDARAGRESTPMISWRVAKKPAKLFDISERRWLPVDRLPAQSVTLHHFYALVPAGGEDYFLVKFSSTEETFQDYRAEFKRFLKSFHVAGND